MFYFGKYMKGKKPLIEITQSLVQRYSNKNYIIAMDRYYTTLDVIENLNKLGFQVICAVMKNRAKLSKHQEAEIKNSKKERQFFIVLQTMIYSLQFGKTPRFSD